MGKGAVTKPRRASRRRPSPAPLVLGAACTLREAASLKAQLLACRVSGDTVTVDGSAVQRIDTAGLQLLVAFARREAGAGRLLQWHAPSDELCNAVSQLGLREVLGFKPSAGAAA